MAVSFSDCSKGDPVFFRSAREPRGIEPVDGLRFGYITRVNKRGLLTVRCRVRIRGVVRYAEWRIKASEIDRFAT